MLKTLTTIWTLFFGIALMSINVGAQGTLLGLRAVLEEFSNFEIGIMMSSYYFGFLVGSVRTPKIIARVGHVRTFAALTSILAITILVHPIYIVPITWALLRFASGFAVSGVWVVSESWLNQSSDNTNRGSIFSIYMITIGGGMAAGQFLLLASPPESYELFTLLSVIVGFAAIPILLTSVPTPAIEQQRRIGFVRLLRVAPTGMFGMLIAGIVAGVFFGMGAAYAASIGFDTKDVVHFMFPFMIGAIIFQWPLGKLSDLHDRRLVTSLAAILAAVICAYSLKMESMEEWKVLTLTFLLGGMSMPLYSLFNAMTNDLLEKDEVTAASGSLLLMNGIGATLGPLIAALVIDWAGPKGFYLTLGVCCLIMGLFSIYRAVVYPEVPEEERSEFQLQAPASVGNILHPEQDEQEADNLAEINRIKDVE